MAAPEAVRLEGWQAVALPEHRRRLDGLGAAWAAAIAAAERTGFRAHLRDEGALLDPDAALPRAGLAPGPYRCRLIRFAGGRRAVTAYRRYFCHVLVEGEQMSLTKDDGSERPGGYLWPDRDERQVFLGAVALGGERLPPAYGEDDSRDLVGVVERVEPFRYRLVMPAPPSGAILDVLELIPFVLDEGE
ncbi:MAG TPA: DUF4893 domain-containing protein [Allosphingosinicella sp.]